MYLLQKKVRLFTIFFLFVFLNAAMAGQGSGKKNSVKWFGKAKLAYEKEQFAEAEKLLMKSLACDSFYLDAYLLLSDLYIEMKKPEQQILALKKIIALGGRKYTLAYKMLGDALYSKGWYKPALEAYEQYRSIGTSTDSDYVSRRIQSSEFALATKPSSPDLVVQQLNDKINSSANEYWPAVMADDSVLFFTRLLTNQSGMAFERIFSSKRLDGGWETPAELIISKDDWINEGTMCISSDGKLLFLTACGRRDGFGSCDIYYSIRSDGQWGNPVNAGPILNSRSWDAQPSVSADGRFLFFASTREGGQGGMDIWRSHIRSDHEDQLVFDEPKNLGPIINSPMNDFSPFIHADGTTLYFASEGHLGFGGSDLFMSRSDFNRWSVPKNLGYPLNSPGNDDGLVVSPTSSTAIYSSNREGSVSGSKDLYQFEVPDEYKPLIVGYMKGYVVDAQTKKPLKTIIMLSESESGALQPVQCDIADGYLLTLQANLTYALNISLPGYLFHSEYIDIKRAGRIDQAVVKNIELQPIGKGQTVVLKNIFFDLDDSKLKPESLPELDKVARFLDDNPTLIIEISGHTDNTGSDDYNLVLSEKRARSIVDYLARKININRLRFKGCGSGQPVADNLTEEGRALNRRSEMKIIAY